MQNLIKHLKEEFYQSRTLIFVVFVFCMAVMASFFMAGNMQKSSATSTAGFKAGNIISDAVMGNYNSMSLDEIQKFLDSKNKCNNTNYDEYLQLSKRYPNITWHWEGEPYNGHFVCMAQEKFGDTSNEIGSGLTAAEIIYGAAQENRINPQVLLVLLQKESSLITDKIPNSLDYSKATGYGCPDTAACDKKYSGFKNQIYRAAELFRYTLDKGSTSYPEGRNVYIGYNPSSSCGGSQVYIENRATAALYRYTPYQPNAAALNAGYGTGNSCSAYGNRNFYLYFTDWFGSTQAAVDGELIEIPDGVYALVSAKDDDLAIAVPAKVQNGSNVEVSSYDASKTILKVSRDPDTGYYTIFDPVSNKVLDLSNAKTTNGNNIQLWQHDKNTCAQKWKIYQTHNENLVIETSCASGMVVELFEGNLQLAVTNKKENEQWKIKFGQVLPDGIYHISTSAEENLQYEEGKNWNGTNVTTERTKNQNSERWQLIYQANGDYYTIINPATNKVLDLSNAKTTNGNNIQLWQHDKNTCAQKWHLMQTANLNSSEFVIASVCNKNYTVNLSSDGSKNVELYYGNETMNWYFATAVPIIDDGNYRLSASDDTEYMFDVSNGGTKNGTNIQGWSLDPNTGAQKWYIEYQPSTDSYIILNPQSNKVLDLSNAKTTNGNNIQLWQHDKNTCAQRWVLSDDGDGRYTIHSACDYNYVIDLSNNKIKNGTNIQIWSHDRNASAQKWLLHPIDDQDN